MSDVTYWECGNCGHSFYDRDGWERYHCRHCGEEMHSASPEGYTSNEHLEDLIDRWRTDLEWAQEHEEICNKGAMRLAGKMIRQLDEVIDDE